MKVQQNNISFKAKVDLKFISNARRYFLKRTLPIQYDQFNKALENMEYIGSPKSQIIYEAKPQKKGYEHFLYLKNTELNPNQAIVIFRSPKFFEITSFFTKINEKMLEKWENLLP